MSTIEELQKEIESLKSELEEATSERVQSAKYGLLLLEEKMLLQQKIEELEVVHNNTVEELNTTQETLNKFECSQRATNISGLEQAETFLSESAERETSLKIQIFEFENENKQLRLELERVRTERDLMYQENFDMAKDKSKNETEKLQLKAEVKDFKLRETRMLKEYSELEEENITLQKQLSSLGKHQIQLECAKHNIEWLTEELESLNKQVDDLSNLKLKVEIQLDDAREALQRERDTQHALKKRDLMYFNNNLTDSDYEEDLMEWRNLESNLYSELKAADTMKELDELKEKLEATENEKIQLTESLREVQNHLHKSQSELQHLRSRLALLTAHIEALVQLETQITLTSEDEPISEAEQLHSESSGFTNWFILCSKEIVGLKTDFSELQKEFPYTGEIANFKNKLVTTEQKSIALQADVNTLTEISQNAGRKLGLTLNALVGLSDDLAQLYDLVCIENGDLPTQVVSFDHNGDDTNFENWLEFNLQHEHLSKNLQDLTESFEVERYLEAVSDQIKSLRIAIEHSIEVNKAKASNDSHRSDEAYSELQEEVTNLKSLLSTKKDQIRDLRNVIKSNKNTAEVVIKVIGSKFKNEKKIVSETMSNLRNELKKVREDQIMLSTLRKKYAERRRKYINQIVTLHKLLKATKEKKRELKKILHSSIRQNTELTMRLEEVEMKSNKTRRVTFDEKTICKR